MKRRFLHTFLPFLAALSLLPGNVGDKRPPANAPPIGMNIIKLNLGPINSLDRHSLDSLAKSGYNTIVMNPVYLQDSDSSSSLTEFSKFSLKNLESVIRESRSLGMKTAIKPLINSRDGESRTKFLPNDLKKWEGSYMKMIKGLSDLAVKDSVDYFVVGTELEKVLEKDPSFFGRASSYLKSSGFRGTTMYAAGFTGVQDLPRIKKLEKTDLDAIGIDFYVPMKTPSGKANHDPLYFLQEIRRNITAKPIYITEYGMRSVEKGDVRPFDYSFAGRPDDKLQAQSYSEFLKSVSRINQLGGDIKGVFIWSVGSFNFSHDIFHPQLTGYNIFGKPAQNIVEDFIKRRQRQ